MQKAFCVCLTFLTFSVFGQEPGHVVYDTSKIAILYNFRGADSIRLSTEDITQIDSLFIQCVTTHNKSLAKTSLLYIKQERYHRQYLPYAVRGEKIVLINCFCTDVDSFLNWRKNLVQAEDGGACFFRLLINLTKRQCLGLHTNGFG